MLPWGGDEEWGKGLEEVSAYHPTIATTSTKSASTFTDQTSRKISLEGSLTVGNKI